MERYKRKPNNRCCVCAKPIYRRPSQTQGDGSRVFCSQACYGISNRKETPCVICGTSILAGQHKKTCSRSCSNKQRAGVKYGRPNGLDKVNSYKVLKVRLLGLRGKACERCGYPKYEILQVHHRDGDRQNNALSNLELVCPNCHCEEHYLAKSWLGDYTNKR